MKNLFSQLENDTIKIISKDGTQISKEFRAVVSSVQVTTFETDIEVQEGDFIERLLPGGKTERFVINESNYSPGLLSIPPSYQFKIRKTTTLPQHNRVTNNYHINGDNSRVYNQSNDNSYNVFSKNDASVFNNLRELINNKVKDDNLITLVNDMEAAKGDKTFVEKYNNFIQSAANHITLIGPFIPQLTAILMNSNML